MLFFGYIEARTFLREFEKQKNEKSSEYYI